MGNIDITLKGAAIHGSSLDIIGQRPQKDILHMIINMQVDLLLTDSELGINILIDEPKLLNKLSPQLIINFGNLSRGNLRHQMPVGFSSRQFSAQLAWPFKASLAQAFLPRMKVNA